MVIAFLNTDKNSYGGYKVDGQNTQGRVDSTPQKPDATEALSTATPTPKNPVDEPKPDFSDALKSIPVIGPLLALLAKHFGIGVTVALAIVLLILPILYPLIMSLLLKSIPESWRQPYAKYVIDAFAVEEVIDTKVDKAVEKVVTDNNERLDFVQQFQQVWAPNVYRSPAYALPLAAGQHFEIAFSAKAVAIRPACKGEPAERADRAINDERLFTIRALGIDRFSVDANNSEPKVFGDKFWANATVELDAIDANKGKTIQVFLNQELAKEVFTCYALTSTMEVLVRKTIRVTKLRPAATASAASSSR